MLWNYKPEDFREDNYGIIPEGNYRVRIEKAEEQVSRSSGKPMIKLTLAVSGYGSKIWCYQVLDNSDREHEQKTNQRLGTIFNSFAIAQGNMNLSDWEGKTGGAYIRHGKDAQNNARAEVAYFLYRKEVDLLPAWHKNQISFEPDMTDFGDTAGNSFDIPF